MTSPTPLPLDTAGLTAEWLGAALATTHDGIQVSAVSQREIIWGTATKVLVKLDYARPVSELPELLCVKGGFVAELRDLMAHGYQTEANFYRDMAAHVDNTPRCHFAATDTTSGQSIVILDDLTATPGQFHDATATLTVDQVAAGLDVLASLHQRSGRSVPWLDTTPFFQPMVGGLLERPDWEEAVHSNTPGVVDVLADRTRVKKAFGHLWARPAPGGGDVIHGDANPTNVFVDAAGTPAFLDWQFVCLGNPLHDVALLVMGALSTEDRRANEISLLAHYVDARADETLTADAAWAEYRCHPLHGTMYALTPNDMQPPPIRAALAQRYAAAAVDLDVFAALDC